MLASENAWEATYTEQYRAKSEENRDRRRHRALNRRELSPEAAAARAVRIAEAQERIGVQFAQAQTTEGFALPYWSFIRLKAREGDADAKLVRNAEEEPIFAAWRKERQAQQNIEVERRLRHGYQSPGGCVGGNPNYKRLPFTHWGLVSEQHPLLQLFVASVPRAKKLRTGNTKSASYCVGHKLLALDDVYVETNRSMRRVLRVELDHTFQGGVEELAAAISALNLPLPNLVVGYIDPKGQLLHPHLIWLIEQSVAFTGKGRSGPQKLWTAVLRGLTAGLLPLGADPGGLNNWCRVKNPLSPEWDCAVLAGAPYNLAPDPQDGEDALAVLAPQLDLEGARALLQASTAARQGAPLAQDHPDPAIAAQSNQLFRHLSIAARARVGWFRDGGNGTEAEFRQELFAEAARVTPMDGVAQEHAAATARSVARWTWGGTVNLLSSNRASWQAEDDAGRDFRLP
ncbi:replication initiation protein, partial [Belnapia sp. T6]